MILAWIDDAVRAGAREEKACAVLGLSARTVQRWRLDPEGDDRREGPHTRPSHALTESEQRDVLAVIHRPEHHDASPKTIVAKLADQGEYIASESTMYRLLRAAGEQTHRGRAKAPVRREAPSLRATAPNQVWSWDITYLLSTVRGVFFYLYLVVDIWSRRIMGWAVHTEESQEHGAALIAAATRAAGVAPDTLTLHADNGGPMRGGTMLAKLYDLGIRASFSRPRVSDDNPFSEALFRTLKYVPQYPCKPFESAEAARRWVEKFVGWYNGSHLHSGIGWVTPEARHRGLDLAQLAARRIVYENARAKQPARWSGAARAWSRPDEVTLNNKDHQCRRSRELTGVCSPEWTQGRA
jgi:transposase InsO family protein